MKNKEYFNIGVAAQALKVIGEHCNELRKSKGYTIEELSRKANIPPSKLISFEDGQKNISIVEFIAIMGSLGANFRIQSIDPDNLEGFSPLNSN